MHPCVLCCLRISIKMNTLYSMIRIKLYFFLNLSQITNSKTFENSNHRKTAKNVSKHINKNEQQDRRLTATTEVEKR